MKFGVVSLRVALGMALIIIVTVGLVVLGGEGIISLWLTNQERWWVLVLTAVAYALLLAVPFVPGVELGWFIIGVFGKPGLTAAWLSTMAGLSLSFTLAHTFRHHPLLERLSQSREALLEAEPATLPPMRRALRYGVCFYVKHPYLFVFLTLNIPGNWVIGGGGGIAAMTGLAPGIQYWRFLLVSAIATGIVPLLLWLGVM